MGIRARLITRRIWEAQGKVCAICEQAMVPNHMEHPTRGWTVDHVWPHSRFPFCERGNLLIAHVECNGLKANRNPTAREQELLAKVNDALGFELVEHDELGRIIGVANPPQRNCVPRIRPRSWCDDVTGPSALALALEEAAIA